MLAGYKPVATVGRLMSLPPPVTRPVFVAAHERAIASLRERGEPSPWAPGSRDVAKQLRDHGHEAPLWVVAEYARLWGLCVADV